MGQDHRSRVETEPSAESLDDILERLQNRRTFGIKLGLDATIRLLDRIGNPHRNLRVIHVAGTNGKGSVAAMLAAMLQAGGYRTGLYSSPHLADFCERMRVDGRMIPRDRLGQYAAAMMPAIEEIGCTFFEGTTAIALRYFADEQVDVAVLETGMGGRLDATNVVEPVVSVITSIGLDHERHLGESYEKIAAEKAGIIKSSGPAVVGTVRPRLRSIFEEKASEQQTDVIFAADRLRIVVDAMTLQGMRVSVLHNGDSQQQSYRVDLVGDHQVENLRTALAVVETLPEELRIEQKGIEEGLASIRGRTGFLGRFDLLERGEGRIILDAAHNPDGAAALLGTLDRVLARNEKVAVLFGAVAEKRIDETLGLLRERIDRLYAVGVSSSRALPSDEIAHVAAAAGIENVIDAGSTTEGFERALAEMTGDRILLIVGSLYLLGDVVPILRKRGWLPEERESTGSVRDRTTIDDLDVAVTKRERHGISRNGTDTPSRQTTDPDRREITSRSLKSWPAAERPRERLRAYGPEALSDAELLAILLRTGTSSKTAVDVARDLLATFSPEEGEDPGDRLVDLTGRSLTELEGIDGIGPVKAVTLSAAFTLGNRIVARTFGDRPAITSPRDAARLFIPRMRSLRKEQFHVVLLDTAGRVMRTEMVSEGNLNSSIVTPREVFRTAIVESAAAIIGLHNHPSGNPEPSREDVAVTRQLVEAGKILEIPLRDHIIIAGEEYVSLADRGVL